MRGLASIVPALALLAGCAAPGGEIESAATPDATTELLASALSAGGTTDAYACVFVAVAGECRVVNEGAPIVPLEAPGALARVEAEVSWVGSSPATMWVWLVGDEGDGYNRDEPLEEETGESPLAISWDLARHADKKLAIVVYSMTYSSAVVAGAGVAPPVDFAIEGEILHEPPAETTI